MNAHLLTLWQTCKRRYRLERDYEYKRLYPNILMNALLRKAVFELSSGMDKHLVTTRAVNTFLTTARDPGLELPDGVDTYIIAMDYVATLRTVIEYLSRLTLLSLNTITTQHKWSCSCFRDESGVLHRWKFVDYLTNENLIREAHSWHVIGDMAAMESPMTLHLISIGRREKSRRVSPWCRTFRSPAVALFRFRKQDGSPLTGDWKPIWFSDNPDSDPEDWVDLMQSDRLFSDGKLVRHIDLKELSEYHVVRFRETVRFEGDQVARFREHPWYVLPMSRGACDNPPCPHQEVCYSGEPEKAVKGNGLYKARSN